MARWAITLGSARAASASSSLRTFGFGQELGVYIRDRLAIVRRRGQHQRDEVAPDRRARPAHFGGDPRRADRGVDRCRSAASASRATTPSTSNASVSGISAGAPASPSASRIRGSSVRNSSWLKRTRTRFGVEGPVLQILGFDTDLDLAVEDRHLTVLEHTVLRVAEVLALLRRQLVEVLEDAFERSVGGHELGGGLLADARYAGKVVAGVTAQRRVLGVLRRRDSPTPLRDAGFVVERVVGDAALVVEDLDVRVGDELERVSVAGHDDHVDPVGRRFRRERRDHVVGLDARDLQLTDLERFEHFMDERQLRREQIRRLFAPRLVVGIQLVAVGAPAGRVERDGDVIGPSSATTLASIDVKP